MISVEKLKFKYGHTFDFELNVEELKIQDKEKVCLVGPSGSGKTTFLNLLSGIYKPQQGSIVLNDVSITGSLEKAIRNFRLNHIGYIFQDFGLVDYLTVEYNILLPFYISSMLDVTPQTLTRLDFLLKRLSIHYKKKSYIKEMSEGERQRVAIARSMINSPSILIGDEPTGNLDAKTTEEIMELLIEIVNENNSTFLCSTHNQSLFKYFDRVIDIRELSQGGKA